MPGVPLRSTTFNATIAFVDGARIHRVPVESSQLASAPGPDPVLESGDDCASTLAKSEVSSTRMRPGSVEAAINVFPL
jgi:hypothetical protein